MPFGRGGLTVKVALDHVLHVSCEQRERVLAKGGSYRCALTLPSPPSDFREEVLPTQPPPKESRSMSPRCTRKRKAHRVGPSGYYSSTLSTGSRTRSERRGC